MSKLEKELKEAVKGQIIEVKTHKERAEAHRIAMREGFTIVTWAHRVGKGFQIVKS